MLRGKFLKSEIWWWWSRAVYGRDFDWRKSTQGEVLVFTDDLEALLMVEEAVAVVVAAVDLEAVPVDLERDLSLACLRMRRMSSRSLLSSCVI